MGSETISNLSSCAEVVTGRNIDKKKLNCDGHGLPYIVGASNLQCGGVVVHRWVNEGSVKNPGISIEGDILLSVVGTLGKMAINTVGRAVLSAHVCAIRIKDGISRQYLMAVLSRIILEVIPDNDDVLLGFQNKLDIRKLQEVEFLLPSLILQEHIVSRLTSIASIIMAYKSEREDLLDFDRTMQLIEQERREQRAHFRKMSEKLSELADMLGELPQDSEIAVMIGEARRAQQRLIKIY